jgi:tetratricopeptide (TPR) repeat protein
VESYLGDYKEAASHFEKSAAYYEKSIAKESHPNIKLNNRLGYFNSLYRLSTCYKNLRLYSKEDSLIQIGLEKLQDTRELTLEYGYFQKGKGVQLLRKHRLDESLKHLHIADEIISDKGDFASLTTVYFYLGKLFLAKPDREQALQYLTKVDSMVNKYHFITPEIRSAYKNLIDDAKKNGDRDRQLYYTDQLLKVDSVINADFVLLASRIHSEYNRKSLIEDKNRLEKEKYRGSVITCLFISTTVVSSFLLVRFRRKAKLLDLKYKEFLTNYKNPQPVETMMENTPSHSSDKKLYTSEMVLPVKEKLKEFEEEKMFLKKILP